MEELTIYTSVAQGRRAQGRAARESERSNGPCGLPTVPEVPRTPGAASAAGCPQRSEGTQPAAYPGNAWTSATVIAR